MLLVACIAATRITIYTLIGTHHLSHLSLLHQCFEGRQVRLPQVALRQVFDVERMTVPFWTAMYGKVLSTSQ